MPERFVFLGRCPWCPLQYLLSLSPLLTIKYGFDCIYLPMEESYEYSHPVRTWHCLTKELTLNLQQYFGVLMLASAFDSSLREERPTTNVP